MTNENIYQKHGYANRTEYLTSVAEDYGVDFITVLSIASVLGKSEDFDGLLSALDDLGDWCY